MNNGKKDAVINTFLFKKSVNRDITMFSKNTPASIYSSDFLILNYEQSGKQ